MRRLALLTTLITALVAGPGGDSTAATEPKTVRDFLWIWGDYEGSYNNEWGLPRNSPITPREGRGRWASRTSSWSATRIGPSRPTTPTPRSSAT